MLDANLLRYCGEMEGATDFMADVLGLRMLWCVDVGKGIHGLEMTHPTTRLR